MKRNYRAVLQYEGTRYQGWQKQITTDNTIQGKLEALLSKMAGDVVEVNSSGRTDAGVHAYGQVISFSCDTDKSPDEIMDYMNQYLPEDIGVLSVEDCSNEKPTREKCVICGSGRRTLPCQIKCHRKNLSLSCA